ncbi:MAG: septum site-determining protein MinC [Candidatus Electrothrix sp. EH2]|nr:septum site-determining protein MinC [Candidatus Electrothrix sp. EH2]
MIELLREQGFIPVGISNCTKEQQRAARAMGLAVLTARGGGRVREEDKAAEVVSEDVEEKIDQSVTQSETADQIVYFPQSSTVIAEPVRSGQRVEAEQGDLIVLASVGSGAEVTAAGNIHIYGALRGRAFAGNTGDTQSRIFCRRLEAELVAVAGYYLVNETIPDSLRGKPVHIRLQSERIRISPL